MVFVACECGDLKGGGGKPSNKKNPQAPPESPAGQPPQVPPPPPDPKQQEQAFLDEVLRKIEAGEPVDLAQASVNGLTALHIAVQHANDPTIIQKLIAGGADIDALDSAGDTPLHHALKAGKWEMAKTLIDKNLIGKKANVNALDGEGNTPLYMVLTKDLKQADNLAMADFLVKNGADIDAAGSSGDTMLNLLISKNNLEAVKFLVLNGAAINDFGSLIDPIAENASLELLQFLKEQGADLTATDSGGRTILYFAYFLGRLDMVGWLLEQQVDLLDVPNNADETPLLQVCKSLSAFDDIWYGLDLISSFIEKGANVDRINRDNITPLSVLEEAKSYLQTGPVRTRLEEIIRLAESKSKNPKT